MILYHLFSGCSTLRQSGSQNPARVALKSVQMALWGRHIHPPAQFCCRGRINSPLTSPCYPARFLIFVENGELFYAYPELHAYIQNPSLNIPPYLRKIKTAPENTQEQVSSLQLKTAIHLLSSGLYRRFRSFTESACWLADFDRRSGISPCPEDNIIISPIQGVVNTDMACFLLFCQDSGSVSIICATFF